MNIIATKQHDTKILFTDEPTIDGEYQDPSFFSGCSLSFVMKGTAHDKTPVAIKSPATIGSTIIDGNTVAQFQYSPADSDVAKDGKFAQEWEIVFPSTKILTFPNDGNNIIHVIADLG